MINDITTHYSIPLPNVANHITDDVARLRTALSTIDTNIYNLAGASSSFVGSAGTYNNVASKVQPITVDAQGRITALGTAVDIAIDWSKVSGRPNTLAGYGIIDAAPMAHASSVSLHLTESQNTLLDSIIVSANEINQLVGVTGAIQTQIASKQPLLTSGVNLKSINGISLLGGGNIDLASISTAGGLATASNIVVISGSNAPSIGQALIATSPTTAAWSTVATAVYAGTTLLPSTSGQQPLTGITGFSTTASSTSTVTSNIAVSTGANSVSGLSYYNTATGSTTISSGSTTSGMSGGVNINSGDAAYSGTITLKPGTSTYFAGDVTIRGGDLNNATESYGGNVRVFGGKGLGGSSGSYGGNLFLNGGTPEGTTVTSKGGDIYMYAGGASQDATGVKTNGNILIGDQTTNIISIASTTVMPNIGSASSAKTINIGTSTSTTTIAGTLVATGSAGSISTITGGSLIIMTTPATVTTGDMLFKTGGNLTDTSAVATSGSVYLETSNTGTPGNVRIKAGTSIRDGGVSASTQLIGGGTTRLDGTGGECQVTGGYSSGAGTITGGNVTIAAGGTSGALCTAGTGGTVYIRGGSAANTTGTTTKGSIVIGDTNTLAVTIGSSSSSASINLPGLGTSGLVSLGTGGLLSAVTPSVGYLNWTGSAFAWSTPATPTSVANISGGTANQIPYQTGVGATGFITPSVGYLNWTGSAFSWGTVSGGATITNDIATNANYYPGLSSATSGSWTTAYTSNTKLYFNPSTGTLYSTLFQSLSDETAKENIVTITNSLLTVNQLNGVEFTWKDNGKPSAGVIAQQLENILPALVATGDDGLKSVNYLGIIGYLIEAVKELTAKFEQLENK